MKICDLLAAVQRCDPNMEIVFFGDDEESLISGVIVDYSTNEVYFVQEDQPIDPEYLNYQDSEFHGKFVLQSEPTPDDDEVPDVIEGESEEVKEGGVTSVS